MKISRIEAIPYAIPYRKPFRAASGGVDTAQHVLVRVHTDDGLVGTADAPPRPFTYGETQASIVAVITDLFAPDLLGLAPLQRSEAHARMNRTVGNPVAKGAIDIALWDLIGQNLRTPVTDLLGGYTDQLRVAHMVGLAEPGEMVDETLRMRSEHGITAFKIKVGRRPLGIDLESCRSIRAALGDDVELYIDGNRGWSAAEALSALRALDDVGLVSAEELCSADDVFGRRWLADRSPIPLIADESAARPSDVAREILGKTAMGISIKTARTGFTYSQRVLHLCEGLGGEVVMGNQIDGQIGTLSTLVFGAANPGTARRPAELSFFLDMTDDLLVEPLVIAGGVMRLPERPGLGLTIDPDKLAHYRQDR